MSKRDHLKLVTPGIPLELTVVNTKMKSRHTCPCELPTDAIGMDAATFTKSYGPHIIKAVHDLLAHPSFKPESLKEKTSLILAP